MKQDYHLLVVGTEISGLVAAYLAAKRNLRVLILDKGELAGNADICGTAILDENTIALIDKTCQETGDIPYERILNSKSFICTGAEGFIELRRKHAFNDETANVSYIFDKAKFIDWLIELAEEAGAEIQSNVIAKKSIVEDGQFVGVEIHTGFEYRAMLTLINDDQQSTLVRELHPEQEIDTRNNLIYASELLKSTKTKVNSTFALDDESGASIVITGTTDVNCIANLYTFNDNLQLNVLVMPIEGKKPISEIDAMQALDEIKNHISLTSIFKSVKMKDRTVDIVNFADDFNVQSVFGNGYLLTGESANLSTAMNRENVKAQVLAGIYAAETASICNEQDRADKKFSGYYFNKL
ncbi:MAG: NAD(P)/FAD-dependent oxidoreductase, partial [Planctomycetes bacterium]|nr:NAD(P)/FAD-dependent oxidoreductase [Planctomycetota bacterium]